MKKIHTILSFTGKPLGYLFQDAEGFGFEHKSGAWENGFASQEDAYTAFDEFHDVWFETITTVY
jgi:hypothetical protein